MALFGPELERGLMLALIPLPKESSMADAEIHGHGEPQLPASTPISAGRMYAAGPAAALILLPGPAWLTS